LPAPVGVLLDPAELVALEELELDPPHAHSRSDKATDPISVQDRTP
jgi:hypothetical protein